MNSLEIRKWFNDNRGKLSRNGVWFSGGEPGTMHPDYFDSAKIKILIVRLSAYEDVASGITHQYLFQMASEIPNSYVDMAFLPPERDLVLMESAGIPLLTGTTSKQPAMNFDVVAISNSVLQELLNLPLLLKLSNIPLSIKIRREREAPFLLLGGSNSYCHSILHGETGEGFGLVDAVICGDGEESFGRFLALWQETKELNRQEQMAKIVAGVKGIYFPEKYTQEFDKTGKLIDIKASENFPLPVKVNKVNLNKMKHGFTNGPILYDGKAAGSSHAILTAGCPSFCSFCKESWEQKPYRERPVERAMADAMLLKANQGLQEISLMTFNLNTYSGIFELLNSLDQSFDRVAIKSQRFDSIALMPELLDRQLLSGKRTYTCAMEGISSRLRKFLQKNLSEDNLMAAFEILFKKQIRQLKIFLILTGYEDQSDIDDFKSFLSSLKALQTSLSNRTKLTFSFATLFRPPLTPFQFSDKRSSIPEMKNALNALAEEILKNGFESRVSAPVYDAIVSEFIAYSDRRATPVLVNSSIAQRFIYRGDVKEKVSDYWIKSMKELGFRHPESFPMDERANLKFPWDDIDAGVKKEFLLSNYLKLKSGEEIFSCISEPWGLGSCSGCGACSSAEEINEKNQFGPTAGHHVLPHSPIKTKKYIVAGQIPEQWGYCDREFIKAAVSRRLMLAYPDLIKPFKKITNIAPTLFSWGKFAAEFEVDETWSPNSRSTVIDEKVWNEVVINKVYPGKNGIADCLFPASVEIDLSKIEESETDISRNIDQLLTKYKIKHMKKRNNGVMNWDVNSGQAKKSGIGQISLNEIERRLTLVLIKWPEIFLINKISYGLPLKVV